MFVDVFLLLLSVVVVCSYLLLTKNLEWENVNLSTVATSNHLDTYSFAWLRILFGLCIWPTLLFLLVDREGLIITLLDRQGKQKMLHLKHGERFTMFTVWCWTLNGLYFALAAYCSFVQLYGISLDSHFGLQVDRYIAWSTWILFEISFAMSYLVTVVVTFVLIPGVRHQGLPTDNFYKFLPLLMHNANVLFMTIEILLSKMQFSIWHFPMCLLYGSAYVVFQWIWFERVGVFYYFFLDYNRPWAILWHMGLLAAVGLFFFFGLGVSMMAHSASVWNHVGVIAIMAFTMKIFDTDKKATLKNE